VSFKIANYKIKPTNCCQNMSIHLPPVRSTDPSSVSYSCHLAAANRTESFSFLVDRPSLLQRLRGGGLQANSTSSRQLAELARQAACRRDKMNCISHFSAAYHLRHPSWLISWLRRSLRPSRLARGTRSLLEFEPVPSGPGWLVRSRAAGTLSSAPVGRCGVDSRRRSAHVAVDVSPQLIMSSRTLRARNPDT